MPACTLSPQPQPHGAFSYWRPDISLDGHAQVEPSSLSPGFKRIRLEPAPTSLQPEIDFKLGTIEEQGFAQPQPSRPMFPRRALSSVAPDLGHPLKLQLPLHSQAPQARVAPGAIIAHPPVPPSHLPRRSHVKSYSTSSTSAPAFRQVAAAVHAPTPPSNGPKAPSTNTGSRFEPRSPGGTRQCTNCAETSTPQWRGQLCNACALWKRARGQDRPVPLRFGGKKVLPPGSRERVKKNTEAAAALAAREAVRGVGQARGDAGASRGAFTGIEGVRPFTLAPRSRVKGASLSVDYTGRGTMHPFRFGSPAAPPAPAIEYIADEPADTQNEGGVRLPPIAPLLAAFPVDPLKVPHKRSSSVDGASFFRTSLSPDPLSSHSVEERITLPYPIPSTFTRQALPSTHTRAASESLSDPRAVIVPFARVKEEEGEGRDMFPFSFSFQTPPRVGKVQGHARYASDSMPALMARRDSLGDAYA